jgi:hypothetical protein
MSFVEWAKIVIMALAISTVITGVFVVVVVWALSHQPLPGPVSSAFAHSKVISVGLPMRG